VSDVYPSGKYAYETEVLQRELIAGGYLPPYNSRNEPSDDGYFGPATRRALQARELDLAEMPAPAKPWWRARRMKGLLLAAAGLAGFFVPALRDVDTAYLVELIWSNLDHVESIITAVGALLTVAGTAWSAIGAASAKGPIDPTLVARVGTHELRIPGPSPQRVREPGRPNPMVKVPPGHQRSGGGFWSSDRGPFNDGH
jgi:hypothetical protein